MEDLSVEEMCRRLLARAGADGLIKVRQYRSDNTAPLPRDMTAGDLTGVANLLCEYLNEARAKEEN